MNNVDFHPKNEKSNTNPAKGLNPSLERIHFRCPNCSKRYSSDPSKIFVEEPEYTCTSCETEFAISFLAALQNSEVVGRAITKQESTAPVETKNSQTLDLPKQAQELDVEPYQGADLARVKKASDKPVQQEFDFAALERGELSFNDLVEENINTQLDVAWGKVLEDYENRQNHNEFIEFCRSQEDMDFAIEKYSSLFNINPHDEIAGSFLRKIEIGAETEARFKEVERSKVFTKTFWTTLGVVLLGILVVALGLMLFQNKNVAGLGIGLIFFTFAARAFFQPRSL